MKKTIKKSIALGMAISMLGSMSAIAGTTATVAKNITVNGNEITATAITQDAPQQPKPCGRWGARHPGDVCSAPTEAEQRPWTHGDKVRFRF